MCGCVSLKCFFSKGSGKEGGGSVLSKDRNDFFVCGSYLKNNVMRREDSLFSLWSTRLPLCANGGGGGGLKHRQLLTGN